MNVKNYQQALDQLYPFLRQYLEEQGIDTSKNFTCISPDHEDRSPSMGIVESEKAFNCFGCGFKGGIFQAASILEDKPRSGPEFITENLKYLADKFGIKLEVEPLTEEQLYELETYRAYKVAADYVTNSAKNKPFDKAIKERKWSQESVQIYGVGCIAEYKGFRECLKNAGFSATFIDDVDLGRKEIFGDDRLIFTIRDHHGRPVGFSSRNLSYTEDKKNGSKYTNQKHTGVKCNIYKKSTRLYGLDLILQSKKKKPKNIYIFEGYSDVITAHQNGITNSVAIAGTALTEEQLYLLKDHGFYNIILCLDGDEAGQKRTAALLDNTLSGHKDLNVQIVIIPKNQDPDEFIRTNGDTGFKKLKKWSAFEWRLSQWPEDADETELCNNMILLIVNESNHIAQEKMIKTLAHHTGVTVKTLTDELSRLQDIKSANKNRERQNIIDKMLHRIERSPLDAEAMMQEAETALFDLSRRYEEDAYSEDSFLSFIESQKSYEEAKDGTFSGFELSSELNAFQNALCGNWRQDVWCCIGGRPNSGKTSFLCKLSFDIASNIEQNNALVIYHSIDDTIEQVLPKFLCIADGNKLELNHVMDPNYHSKNHPDLFIPELRESAYSVIKDMGKNGRLIIKDANNGVSLGYADKLIKWYRAKYPDRNIVYILDNFHKLQDFSSKTDERVRFKELSKAMKGLATKHHICVITTVEYRKTQKNGPATNADISETIQIEYDANLIAHLHNDLHDKGVQGAELYHGEGDHLLPTIELNIGKNKITSFKGRIFFDFFPSKSNFIAVSDTRIEERAQKASEGKKTNNKNDDDLGSRV